MRRRFILPTSRQPGTPPPPGTRRHAAPPDGHSKIQQDTTRYNKIQHKIQKKSFHCFAQISSILVLSGRFRKIWGDKIQEVTKKSRSEFPYRKFLYLVRIYVFPLVSCSYLVCILSVSCVSCAPPPTDLSPNGAQSPTWSACAAIRMLNTIPRAEKQGKLSVARGRGSCRRASGHQSG